MDQLVRAAISGCSVSQVWRSIILLRVGRTQLAVGQHLEQLQLRLTGGEYHLGVVLNSGVGELRVVVLPEGSEPFLLVEQVEDHVHGGLRVDIALGDLGLLDGGQPLGEYGHSLRGEVVADERPVSAVLRGPLQPGTDEEVAIGLGEHTELHGGFDGNVAQHDCDVALQVEPGAGDGVDGLACDKNLVEAVLTSAASEFKPSIAKVIMNSRMRIGYSKDMNKKLIVILAIVGIIGASVVYVVFRKGDAVPQDDTNTVTTTPPVQLPSEQQVVSKGVYVDYASELLSSIKGTRLLFFHASWCPQCRELDESIKNSVLPEGLTIFKVDYDSNQSLRAKYGVTLQTTVVKVDEDNTKLASYVAYDEPTFQSVTRALLP